MNDDFRFRPCFAQDLVYGIANDLIRENRRIKAVCVMVTYEQEETAAPVPYVGCVTRDRKENPDYPHFSRQLSDCLQRYGDTLLNKVETFSCK